MVVDDEAVVTQSLGAFLELETDHQVVDFQNPLHALEYLNKKSIDVVISDFLMPQMNGIEFLSEVKKRMPDVPRIILTGYADKENSIRAINEVGIFQYVEKPWDNDQIKLIVDNALAQRSLREQLSDRINALDRAIRERDHLAVREEHMRRELDIAERLQRSMLPSSLSVSQGISLVARFLPALQVGGDFYDITRLSGDRLATLVADATGHGIQAALSTAALKLAFQSFAHCDCTPSDILQGMNRILRQGLPEDTYVAALVAAIDPGAGEIRIANAGLPTPYLVRRAAGEVRRLATTGLVLGAVDDDLYRASDEVTFELESGDVLWLYTDGLSESQNRDGEHFDDALLSSVLADNRDHSAEQTADALLAASRSHSHEGHEWDDVTILGIEVAR